jgi:molecular chaperone GrpE
MNETNTNSAGPADQAEGTGPRSAGGLEERLATLEIELADVRGKYLMTLADYQNSQRRAVQNEAVAKDHGKGAVIQQVVAVMDHFDIAFQQDVTKMTAEQAVSGLRVIRDELMRVLQSLGVGMLSPARNDEFVPGRHEAVVQQSAEGVEPGRIVQTLQAGYTLSGPTGDRVLRPAKVMVAPNA